MGATAGSGTAVDEDVDGSRADPSGVGSPDMTIAWS
jgi:hypothetical protein